MGPQGPLNYHRPLSTPKWIVICSRCAEKVPEAAWGLRFASKALGEGKRSNSWGPVGPPGIPRTVIALHQPQRQVADRFRSAEKASETTSGLDLLRKPWGMRIFLFCSRLGYNTGEHFGSGCYAPPRTFEMTNGMKGTIFQRIGEPICGPLGARRKFISPSEELWSMKLS